MTIRKNVDNIFRGYTYNEPSIKASLEEFQETDDQVNTLRVSFFWTFIVDFLNTYELNVYSSRLNPVIKNMFDIKWCHSP